MFSLGFGASVAVLKNLEDKENTKEGHEGMFGMFWYVLSFVNVLIFGTKDLFCIQDMMGRMKFITDVGHWRLQSYQLLKCLSSSMSPSWLPCVRTRCRSLLQKMLQPWLPESFNSPWLYMFNPCIQLAPGWFHASTLTYFQVQMSSKMSPELELFVVCGWGILVHDFMGETVKPLELLRILGWGGPFDVSSLRLDRPGKCPKRYGPQWSEIEMMCIDSILKGPDK